MVAGGIAGAVSKTLVYPLDTIRKRLQIQGPHLQHFSVDSIPRHETVGGVVKKIVEKEGWRGFYKGWSVSMVKAVPASAVTFAVYGFMHKIL